MISVVRTNDLRLTITGQNALLNGQARTLEKLDAAKRFVNLRNKADSNDFAKQVHLTKEANTILNTFITGFLQSSFNRIPHLTS